MSAVSQPATLAFDRITFSYGDQGAPAVSDIDLVVNPGELVVLVGPSGCGKSTLLRIVAGLINPNRGRLLLDGSDTLRRPPHHRRIGCVPQSYALFDHLNVADNVAFGLRMQQVRKADRADRVREMLELCRIPELAHRAVGELSGGQRQRVAIARALAVRPRVLLLDEPLTALDPQLRVALRADLEDLLRRSGLTTLFVTHDQSEALAIADRVVVLREGRIEQYGTPEELWEHPENEFVAEFLGSAKVVRARRVGERVVEIAPGLDASVDAMPGDGEYVSIALRATDLTYDPQGVRIVVTGVEYAGASYVITGKIPGGPLVSFLFNERLAVGSEVPVGLCPNTRLTVIGQ